MTKPVNDFYDFGEFRLDPVRRVLLRGSEVVPVPPKAFDTLLVLLEGRDRVMEKDELMRRVWPDTIVEEVGLAKHISALRKAFGERLGEHRYIVTVPGRGYRFVAEVTVVGPNAEEAEEGTSDGAAAPVMAAPAAAVPAAGAPVAMPAEAAPVDAAPAGARRTPPPRALAARYAVLGAAFALVVVAALMASAWFSEARRPAAATLTSRDTILLAGFANQTDEPIFGDTLRQGLAAQLEQSPFLNLFPDDRARASLRLLGHSADAPMTREAATELCRREGIKAFVSGTIAPVGRHFVITLEATDHNGGTMAREQAEAGGKEEVLAALTQAAGKLRERLGESIGSVRAFGVPAVTTSSLEALMAHGEALTHANEGRWREAIPAGRRAVELDPNFATAYMTLGLAYSNLRQRQLAVEAIRKAYALRDHAGAYESARILHAYHLIVTGDYEKLVDALERHRQTYPRDSRSYAGLSAAYLRLGQFDNGVDAARNAIRLSPDTAVQYVNLAQGLLRLGRYDEASQTVAQSIERFKHEADLLRPVSYAIAFIRGDADAMRHEIEALTGKPGEHLALAMQSGAAGFSGRWREAEKLSRRAIDLAVGNGLKGQAAEVAADAALRAAVVGRCAVAGTWTTEALALESHVYSMGRVSFALALCGEARRAHAIMDAMSAQFPENTVVQAIRLPIVRAALELEPQRGAAGGTGATAALELLKPVRYQAAAEFSAQYLRGLAWLRLQKGHEAAEEFRAILGARGQGPASILYPLAHLGLARASTIAGDTSQARKSYDDFFTLWKDADNDLIPLTEARADSRKLSPGSR